MAYGRAYQYSRYITTSTAKITVIILGKSLYKLIYIFVLVLRVLCIVCSYTQHVLVARLSAKNLNWSMPAVLSQKRTIYILNLNDKHLIVNVNLCSAIKYFHIKMIVSIYIIFVTYLNV